MIEECKYCNKECKNKNSLSNHEIRCKKNPYKIDHWTNRLNAEEKNKITKNATKAVVKNRKGKTFEEIFGKKRASKIKSKLRNNHKKCKTIEIEINRRNKISETMKKNPNAGGYRIGSGRCKGFWYKSKYAGTVYLNGTYELEYAKYLDRNKIDWRKNTKKFPYEWQGKLRYYIPDFYLVKEKTYDEIKGFKTEKDEAKWKHFPHVLKIVFKNDLLKLGLNVK